MKSITHMNRNFVHNLKTSEIYACNDEGMCVVLREYRGRLQFTLIRVSGRMTSFGAGRGRSGASAGPAGPNHASPDNTHRPTLPDYVI